MFRILDALLDLLPQDVVAALDRIPTPLFWRSRSARSLGRAFDRRFGTDTQSPVQVGSLGLTEDLARHAVLYEPSSIPKLKRALRQLRIRHEEFVFIDIGSGKGLVCMIASQLPFRRVIGVEASAELCAVARSNLSRFQTRRSTRAPVEFVNKDALDFDVPRESSVFYLYNPFDEAFIDRFLARLRSRDDCRTVIVYVNPLHKDMVLASAPLTKVFEDTTLCMFELHN